MALQANKVRLGLVATIIVLAGAVRQADVGRGPLDPLDDPFGDLLPPTNNNPNLRSRDPVMQNEERLLASESLLDDQVELREEEQMEVLCAATGNRESSNYDSEQLEEESVEKDVRTWVPTDAEHKCLPIKLKNKYVPGYLLGLTRQVPVPVFPERLGELVIEAVTHTDKGSKKHIVLEVSGCSSCENDETETVEWAGLLPLDETGSPAGMKARAGDEEKTKLVEGPDSSMFGASYPRAFSFDKCPYGQQKYVKRYMYKYSSYRFDEVVEPEALELVQKIPADQILDAPHLHEDHEDAVKLMEDLKAQVTHIPFNHKLEQLHMGIKICEMKSNALKCSKLPEESIILHDGGLVVSSAQTMLFDELGRKTGEQCKYGPCFDSHGEKTPPRTMCSLCGKQACPSTRTNPKQKSSTSQGLPSANFFNCLVERVWTRGVMSTSYEDVMMQAENDNKAQFKIPGNGFLYRGTTSPGHVEGHINWHISVPPQGHCEPVLQDAVYVGLGVDEADRCKANGRGVDVDIGVILLQCAQEDSSDLMGNIKQGRGRCGFYDRLNFAYKKPNDGATWYGISGDNRGGEGEGDDEWIFVDLESARQKGVSHVVLMANIFGCEDGRQPKGGPLQWGELEGAFMRITASGKTEKQFTAAETISYVDLDEMKGGANAGAAVFMLYLGGEGKLAVPDSVKKTANRKDGAASVGKAWKLVSLKKPVPGTDIGNSFSKVADWLYSGTLSKVPERDIDEQTVEMGLADTISTGQQVREHSSQNNGEILTADWTPDLEAVITEGIQEDLRHEQPNENAHEKRARQMTEEDFQKHFSEYLPEGSPGTDSFCANLAE